MLLILWQRNRKFHYYFFVTDPRIQPRWKQQFETQRKCQRSGLRHGFPEEEHFGLEAKSDPSDQLILPTGKKIF